MSKELAAVSKQSTSLAAYSVEQLDILRRVICPTLTNDELAFFSSVCQRMELDPFAKEIYAVKTVVRGRNNEPDTHKLTWMVGIDGYLSRAESSGEFEGTTSPQWCGADGTWRDVWLSDHPPAACRVGVHRKGWKDPAWGIARYSTFVQEKPVWVNGKISGFEPTGQWGKGADNMLRKCALAQAIRLAFPRRVGDTMTPDELGTVEVVDEMSPPPAAERPKAPALVKEASRAEVKQRLAKDTQPKPAVVDPGPAFDPKIHPTAEEEVGQTKQSTLYAATNNLGSESVIMDPAKVVLVDDHTVKSVDVLAPVTKAIADAKTVAELNAVKPQILALTGSERATAIAAWNARGIDLGVAKKKA
jgi:phage recombination protein Bet